ncbi:hypothetical protein LQW54_008459 [Pestalotiopsis sp. IQ-011]
MQRLQGKVAIVTGSSSGIGRAIALAYSREGAAVVCADLNRDARSPGVGEEALPCTDQTISSSGGQAIFVQTNVSLAADVQAMVDSAVSKFGRVDILVNNAGVSMEARGAPLRVHETPEDTWDATMAVNAKSVFYCCKYGIAQMLRQEVRDGHRGWIVNMSSIFGLVGGRANISYAASKAAVANMTRQVALDYAEDKIHCNAICPGYTNTAIFSETIANLDDANSIEAKHPFGGVGNSKDIVGAAIFLACPEASWITGVCLPVDGGYTAQ